MSALQKTQPIRAQITLVDGSTLKSRNTFDRSGKFWQSYQIIKPGVSKQHLPLVSGKSSGGQFHLAVLDFDFLAPGFTSYGEMAALFDNPACTVTASPSGKLKVFVQIKWRDSTPQDSDVLEFLKSEVCPPELWSSIDKKGLWNFYLTGGAADALSFVSSGLFLDASLYISNMVSVSSKEVESQRFSYKVADTSIPATYEEFVARKNRGWEAREIFVKILLASYRLNGGSGWGLSQRALATQLGVSISSVNGWIKHFKETGWLTKVSNRYIHGVEAISYVAGFDLIKDVAAYKESQKVNNVRQMPKKLPKNGEYHAYFLSLAAKYPSWQLFKDSLEATPGMNRKRYKHAEGIFNCQLRKLNKSLLANKI